MPASLEQLDLLLLTVARMRRVQQDGILFQSHRYMDINLAALMKPIHQAGLADSGSL